MTKLARYLKPFIALVLLCFALLFVQAMCELNLPNLMSDIVDTGIQQGGIEDAAPIVIGEKEFVFLQLFLSEQDGQTLREAYTYLEEGTPVPEHTAAAKLKTDNGLALTESSSVYVRQTVDKDKQAQLNRVFGAACATMETYAADHSDALKDLANTAGAEGVWNSVKVNLPELYKLIPQIQQGAGIETYLTAAQNLDPMVRDQMAKLMDKQFYSSLGINLLDLQNAYIFRMGLLMVLVTLLDGTMAVLVAMLASRVGAAVSRNLRHDVFVKVQAFSHAEFDKYSTASLITRTTNDVTQVQQLLILGIRMVCYAPILAIGGLIMATSKTVSMTWIIVLGVLLLIGSIILLYILAMPKFKRIQKLVDKLNLITRESLSGMMVIRAFGTQKHEEQRFDEANHNLTSTNLFVNRLTALLMPFMMFLMNGINVLIVWVGGHQIASSSMQIGDMMAFMQYAMLIIMAFLMISIVFLIFPRASVSAQRIAEVLDCPLAVTDQPDAKALTVRPRGEIAFHDVSFSYEGADEPALSHIDFVARPGQMTALIGATGSGKSTLINLIPRFYDVTAGSITLDGTDIRELRQKELRQNIGFVPQKGVLFSGDIGSNITYGVPGASEQTMHEAAEVAQSMEFIDSKPQGFATPIAQGGTNVSGGQKQRLAIARALVKKAPIYIFDDSFSALDFKTDAALRQALKTYAADATMILVAQRVSTIMEAEQILVLEEGRVVGKGTHKQLLESCPAYQEIASSQLSKEELAHG